MCTYNLCSQLHWWVSVLLHDAFAGGISHLSPALHGLLFAGSPMWWYRQNYQTHTVICAHNTLFLSVHTISVVGCVDGWASCCKMHLHKEHRTCSKHYAVSYSQGHQCGGIGINYQTHTHRVICAHNTLFLSTHTISVAGRVLAARHSHVCLHFAVLTCTLSCFVSVYRVAVLRH